jgi:Kef-type K+ transport system membrane component KefB
MLTSQILLQLIVILLVVQFFGYLSRFIGEQWVIGEILAGLALGPSLLGHFLPGVEKTVFPVSGLPTLQTLGDIGLILYMFSLGANIDTNVMLRQSRKALVVSLTSVALPLVMGATMAYFLYPGMAGSHANLISFMLLVGTAMAITAFPVLARLLTERNMLSTKIGTLALTSAAVNDIIAWCLLALIIAIVHASGATSALITIGETFLFIGVMLGAIRPLLLVADRRIASKPLLLALTMIMLLLSAYATNAIGIHPVFGAFLMGIIVPRKTLFIELVRSIDKTNSLLFLPLYFVYTGLRTQIGLIGSPGLWLICLLVLLIACSGKIFGGAFSARLFGDSWKDAFGLGVLMNTRGLVELIVLNIGLDLGVLSPTLFAILVIMAILTTMMASPILPLLGYGRNGQLNKKITRELDKDVEGQVIAN